MIQVYASICGICHGIWIPDVYPVTASSQAEPAFGLGVAMEIDLDQVVAMD